VGDDEVVRRGFCDFVAQNAETRSQDAICIVITDEKRCNILEGPGTIR